MTMRRRDFLKASLSSAGGLMLSFNLPAATRPYQQSTAGAEINAWLTIDPDDTITIRVAQAEMGQGVFTSMPMIIAEELEADWGKVKAEYADMNRQIRSGGIYKRTVTEGSNAVRHSRPYLQQAGAEARERLIKAAAEKWVVSPEECYADYGRVYHRPTRRSVGYGEVAAAAANVNVAGVKIKTPDEFNNLGLPTKRLDGPAKVDGSAIYGIDVRVPDMVYAAVKHCPVLGGRVRSMRFNAVRNMSGVLQAVRMEHSVAVVAETFWEAKLAADKIPIYWDIGEAGKTFSDTFKREFFEEFSREGEVIEKKGDIVNLMDYAEKTIESDYYVPYLAHAAMEPINCTVHVQDDRVDVWVGHQAPEASIAVVSKLTGIAKENIYLHNCYLGGGFGRRSDTDFVEEATLIAMEVRRPVQMIWTREEDMKAGSYRPMSAMRFKAGFNLDKELVAFTNHSVTHSILYDNWGTEDVDPFSIESLVNHPYNFPAYKFTHTRKQTHLTSWWWRSVGHSINVYTRECFMDEMATAAGRDPLRYRRQLLEGQDEYLNVLDVLEQESGWGKRRFPRESAMGMAINKSHGTIIGVSAVVTVKDGSVKVDEVTAVVDCGNIVNPIGAEEQVEGGIIYGLSAAIYGKLTVENGVVLEDNLDTYEMLGMHEAPNIKIHWALSGGDHWGGLGEPSTPLIAPAVCNALFKITGRRIRSLPIKDYVLRVR